MSWRCLRSSQTKTELGMRAATRVMTSPDTSQLVLEPFKGSVPDQRARAEWALNCFEVNWDYARRGAPYRFQTTKGLGITSGRSARR